MIGFHRPITAGEATRLHLDTVATCSFATGRLLQQSRGFHVGGNLSLAFPLHPRAERDPGTFQRPGPGKAGRKSVGQVVVG